jgi:hypothetical protein
MKKIKIVLWTLIIGSTFSCSKDAEVTTDDSSEIYFQDKEVEILF